MYVYQEDGINTSISYCVKSNAILTIALTSCLVAGDLEAVTQMSTYMGTLRCMSQVEVIQINSKNWDRLVVKKSPRTQEQLREHAFDRHTKLVGALYWYSFN